MLRHRDRRPPGIERVKVFFAGLAVLLGACVTEPAGSARAHDAMRTAAGVVIDPRAEQPVQRLALAGDLAERKVEISGFAWYGEQLVVLPQRPTWNAARGPQGCFYTLGRGAIERAIAGDAAPLEGSPLPLRGFEQVASLEGVQGFEALAFQGDRVFLLVEAQSTARRMRGYLVLGHVEGALTAIVIDRVSPIQLPAQTGVDNLSYEALVTTSREVVALYEASGQLNPHPYALRFDLAGSRVDPVGFPHIEYRITDATPPGTDGRFWAINYFYPPELALSFPVDPLSEKFGLGPTQRRGSAIERLVPLQMAQGRVTLVDEPPVRLRLVDERPRNWEAIAVLPGRGFLLATDRHPVTEMGFVAYPLP